MDKPDLNGREEILKIHAKGKPLADDIDFKIVARRTPGFTGADLENVFNEAAILAARRDKKKVTMEEVEEAIDLWLRLANEYPSSNLAPEALFLAGIASYRLGKSDQTQH